MEDKRVYVFDWDDNIIHMPTTIKMEHYVRGNWDITDVSTKQYAENKDDSRYRLPLGVADPYLNFSNNPQFIIDLSVAIKSKSFGPSFSKFKECLMYGNDFAIITARGQSKDVILAGIIMIIGKTFYDEEMNMMISNVGNINDYLKKQVICPVTSPEMSFPEIKESGSEDTIELRKVLALDSYVDIMLNEANEIEFDGKFSIGISDDDKRNINSIKDFIEKVLKPKNPDMHFVVYDTSNPKNIIKRPV